MRDDARLAEPADDAVGHVTRALRGAAREHQHVGVRQRAAHGGFEFCLIVGNGAEEHRLAAVLVDRGGDDGAVGVVDRSRRERLAGLNQFVTGGDHGNTRLARDSHLGNAASRQHAYLARADHRAGAQQRLAARDVGACVGHELSGRNGSPDVDRIGPGGLGMLDHDDGVGAAR
ncbi:hypothetical protein ABIF99_009502 [Bradyrhizobium japonicum]